MFVEDCIVRDVSRNDLWQQAGRSVRICDRFNCVVASVGNKRDIPLRKPTNSLENRLAMYLRTTRLSQADLECSEWRRRSRSTGPAIILGSIL